MCGTAGLSVPAHAVAAAVQRAGCPVRDAAPAAYRVASTKKADGDAFPCVVVGGGDAGLRLETLVRLWKLMLRTAQVEDSL